MEVFQRLPDDIRLGMFRFFSHPVADLVRLHHRGLGLRDLMADVRDYHETMKVIDAYPRDHGGIFGRSTMLNNLWGWGLHELGSYYKIWERMYRIPSEAAVRRFISLEYAWKPHTIQIRTIWALFTKDERRRFLENMETMIIWQ